MFIYSAKTNFLTALIILLEFLFLSLCTIFNVGYLVILASIFLSIHIIKLVRRKERKNPSTKYNLSAPFIENAIMTDDMKVIVTFTNGIKKETYIKSCLKKQEYKYATPNALHVAYSKDHISFGNIKVYRGELYYPF